jgi:anti-sigma regulatory factor (Ser/Thr protein kinase)
MGMSTAEAFRHEAFLYAGDQGFLDGALPFVRDGLAAEEPTLVMVPAEKIDLLRSALDGDAERVLFADMAEVGRNPARIIPAWREFADENAGPGGRLRGIGEPIWADRSAQELVECQRHESLLNLAFADARGFTLLCPYDTAALPPAVIDEALCSHPFIVQDGGGGESADYRGLEAVPGPFAEPLPDPPGAAPEIAFEATTLDVMRRFVSRLAAEAGMNAPRTADLVLAANEVATNSVRHAGGQGTLRMWQEEDAVVCEVRDTGHIHQPLAGRARPADGRMGGHGLWVVNQLCDLVQLRSFSTGSLVRLHMRLT